MIDTALSSLAQNLDGPDWPLDHQNETPAKYIDLDFAEVIALFRLNGQKPELVDQLVGILQGTLAFDRPFGEMVTQAEATAARENPLLKNLARLGIPENFPVTLTALEAGTLEFCRLEKLSTLGEFAVFVQGMAQSVIVGGDFKKLLNALSQVDEAALAEVLPFRRGAKDLHLAEALAQATRYADADARAEAAANWFWKEFAAIKQDVAAGGALARHFAVIGEAETEKRAAQLLQPYLHLPTGRRVAVAVKKVGLIGWLFGKTRATARQPNHV